MAEIKAFYDETTGTVSYIVSDPTTHEAAFIDPILDFDAPAACLQTTSVDAMLTYADEHRLKIVWSLETHIHADHLSASDYVREKTGAKIGIGELVSEIQTGFGKFFNLDAKDIEGGLFDALFTDGDTFQIGELDVRVLHTPGHTPACVTYLVDASAAFVGDTLFMPDYGSARADFPGGDAKVLYESIRKILSLPSQTQVFVAHDYLSSDRPDPAWVSTVEEQARENIHANRNIDERQFVDLRVNRDAELKAPKLILPSLQVNIRAGQLPIAEADGTHYLKLPINRFGTTN